MAAMVVAARFRAPFGIPEVLDLPWNATDAYAVDCTPDGNTVVGYIYLGPSSFSETGPYAVRWDNSNNLTILQNGGTTIAISADGSTIVGYNDHPAAIGARDQGVVWKNGAIIGTLLPVPAGYEASYFVSYTHCVSDDGSVIVGSIYPPASVAGSIANCRWTNLVPQMLPLGGSTQMLLTCCSNDGSIAVAGQLSYSSGYGWVGYYDGSNAYHNLAPPAGVTILVGSSHWIKGDGTIIYGAARDQYGVYQACYWDSLSTTSIVGGVVCQGVCHLLPAPAAGNIRMNANDINAAVGYFWHTLGLSPIRWDGTSFTDLNTTPLPLTMFYGQAMAVSGDGSVLAGDINFPGDASNNYLPDGNSRAGFWLADNIPRKLNTPVPWAQTSGNSYAPVVSRDGSTIITLQYPWDNSSNEQQLSWEISAASGTDAGIGQAWFDPSYVDFNDPTVLAKFVNPDGTWVSWGEYGELPTGISPINFLNAEDPSDPTSILWGNGQDGSQYSWSNIVIGPDPSTGGAYLPMAFDECDTTPKPPQPGKPPQGGYSVLFNVPPGRYRS